jgi:hypothetical protein
MYLRWPDSALYVGSTISLRTYFNIESQSLTGATQLIDVGTPGVGNRLNMRVNASLVPTFNTSSGSVLATGSALSLDTWYRFETWITLTGNTSTGRTGVRLYLGDSTTPLLSYDSTSFNFGTNVTMPLLQLGRASTDVGAISARFDDLAADDAIGETFIGPGQAPTVPYVFARGGGNGATGTFALTTTQVPATRAVGDLIVLTVETAQGDTMTDPTGYTLIAGPVTSALGAVAADNSRLYVYARVATADASDLPTLPDAGDHTSFEVAIVRNWNSSIALTSLPVATGSLDVAGDVVTFPDLSVPSENWLIAAFAASGLDTPSEQYVSRSDRLYNASQGTNWNAAGQGGGFAGAWGNWGASGTLSGMTLALNAASNLYGKPMIVIAIAPPPANLLITSPPVAVVSGATGDISLVSGGTAWSVDGTVAVTTATTGTITSKLPAAGTVAVVSTVAGTITSKLPAAGTVAVTSAVTGAISRFTSAAGTVVATTATSGAITSRLPAAGAISVVSTVAGAITSVLPASGTVVVVSTVSGAIQPSGTTGTVTVTSGVTGTFGVQSPVGGTVAVLTASTGTIGVRYSVGGTVAVTSTTSASIVRRTSLVGTIAVLTAVQGAIGRRTSVGGQVDVLSTVDGTIAFQVPMSGTVIVVSDASGSITVVTPGPGGGPIIIYRGGTISRVYHAGDQVLLR